MTDELSNAELNVIEERTNAASTAPWESFIEGRDRWGGDDFIRVGGLDDAERDMYAYRDTAPAGQTDLDFIAHARQDIPRLIETIRALAANGDPTRRSRGTPSTGQEFSPTPSSTQADSTESHPQLRTLKSARAARRTSPVGRADRA